MIINQGIFREYDIRGITGRDINREVAVALGKSFAELLRQDRPLAEAVSVGRDIRNSSEELASGLIDGIMSSGLNVCYLGACPTPLQYFSLFHLSLDGGIMVTGSHNPPEYNGFKVSLGTETIHGRRIQELKEVLLRGEFRSSSRTGAVRKYDIIDAYSARMEREFSHLGDYRFRPLKVVIDAGNGTAGLVVPQILEKIGCEVIRLYCEPDGNFPNHHPDPTVVEYIQDLISETRRSKADIGVGYDGDADRIGVVDREGEVIWGDQLMIVISRDLLKSHPGAKIIGDVKCSQVMFDDIAGHGGIPIMWKTGHSLVKQKMRDDGAMLAGEFSGHIFIGERYFGYDDAVYATLRLVEIMKRAGGDIKDLLADVPKVCFTPEVRIECPDEKKKRVVENVVRRFIAYRERGDAPFRIVDMSTIDGIRVRFDHGWGLLRSSNTQPVMVMRVEATDAERLKEYREFLEAQFRVALEQA